MKRVVLFLVAVCALALAAVGSAQEPAATVDRMGGFQLLPGIAPQDSTFRMSDVAANTYNRPARRWTMIALGDTVRVTFYGHGIATPMVRLWRLAPNTSLSSDQLFNVPIDSVVVDRKTSAAFFQWLVMYAF